jgi:hypothetical protein
MAVLRYISLVSIGSIFYILLVSLVNKLICIGHAYWDAWVYLEILHSWSNRLCNSWLELICWSSNNILFIYLLSKYHSHIFRISESKLKAHDESDRQKFNRWLCILLRNSSCWIFLNLWSYSIISYLKTNAFRAWLCYDYWMHLRDLSCISEQPC